MKIVFAGTAAFAVPSLQALVQAGHEVALVVTQPDRPGHRLQIGTSPVKEAAIDLRLELFQPMKIGEPEAVRKLGEVTPDVMIVVAYGQIISAAVLAIPKLGAINVHASLLPRHRGAAPVARALLAGDLVTGVTIMRMDEQLDHGPILAVRSTEIEPNEDSPSLTTRLSKLGAELLVDTLAHISELTPVEQDHSAATVAPRLRKEEGELEWALGAEEIDRRVRALQPWPGVTLPTKRGPVKILRGHLEGDRYVPDLVQVPGKRPAPAKQVLGDA